MYTPPCHDLGEERILSPQGYGGLLYIPSSISGTRRYREPEVIGLETIRLLDPLGVDVGDVVKEMHGECCWRCGMFSSGTWESDL